MGEPFRPGDVVIWLKQVQGDYVFPVKATVLSLTEKRVKIEAEDEEGRGLVIRYVSPERLQHHR